jgi:hypothetical protein
LSLRLGISRVIVVLFSVFYSALIPDYSFRRIRIDDVTKTEF